VAVVREASTSGLGFDFDVIHALDWRARPAAGELAARSPGSVLAASHDVGDADDLAEHVAFGPREAPDAWICDHPWAAERLQARVRGEPLVFTVATSRALEARPAPAREAGAESPAEGPCVVLSLGPGARASSRTVVRAVRSARERVPGLVVALFDASGRHGRLARRLERAGLASSQWGAGGAPRAEEWNAAVAQAAAVGVASRDLVDDATAHAAWLAGVPVVSVRTADADALATALADVVFNPDRRDHDVRARAALAARRLAPGGIAAARLRAYFLLLDRKRIAPAPTPADAAESPRPLAFPDLRSRLTLTPVSTREALASWSVRPDDWRSALQWLGPEAARAVLTIRLFDVTDVAYDGMNAHSSFDVDLSLGENHRVVAAPYDGRSLAACLGVRSQWGYFHPLAHARICHLPREGLAPSSGVRRLRIMPRPAAT
jgi:hypothetical protein